MIRFDCDYLEGAHPKVLKKIVETNYEQTAGYSRDEYTSSAIKKIKKLCKREDIDVHILVSGTQTNFTVISSALKSYQAVICTDSAHINVHETGAVESLGNKIITIKNNEGKLSSKQVEKIVAQHYDQDSPEHTVMPKLVFITLPTEYGTNYTKKEIEDIYNVCKKNDMYLYIDGARLGYGLVAKDTDIKISDLPNMCDAFYIGGTKQGALFGEAVVLVNNDLKKDFRYFIKQRGGLLAKGRLLGIQFDTLLDKDLYFTISKHAVELALRIKEAFINAGFKLKYNSFTNQQFVILPNEVFEKLNKEFALYKWEKEDSKNVVARVCTSWATTEENVNKLIEKIQKL